MKWQKKMPEAAQAYLEKNRLDEVECVIADLPGIARGKAVPAAKWEKQTHCFLVTGIRQTLSTSSALSELAMFRQAIPTWT